MDPDGPTGGQSKRETVGPCGNIFSELCLRTWGHDARGRPRRNVRLPGSRLAWNGAWGCMRGELPTPATVGKRRLFAGGLKIPH